MAEFLVVIPVVIVIIISSINSANSPKVSESDVKARAEKIAEEKEKKLSEWPKSTDPYHTTIYQENKHKLQK